MQIRAVSLLLLGLLIVTGCVTVPTGDQLDRVWQSTTMGVPDSFTTNGKGFYRAPRDTDYQDKIATILPGQRFPAVIFLHGCAGGNRGYNGLFAENGFLVFAPNSFDRGTGRKSDCAKGSNKKNIIRLRFEEARDTAARVRQLPWVDIGNLFLAGFSEGGTTTALYSGDEFKAAVITGWTCTSSLDWWQGVRLPSSVPVLAVVGELDPYYYKNSNSGHCGSAIWGRRGSESILIPGGYHDVRIEPGIDERIIEFLRQNTDS